ncbi:MAG: DUF1636 family protein [Paracoccaceae bacterium]
MTTWITICDTCKFQGRKNGDMALSDGEKLAGLIERHAATTGLRTRRTSCLMGCAHGCNITIQAVGKLAYTLGRFSPDEKAARAIVSYGTQHAASTSGQVPFRQWPEAIKGHFITRHQPLPEDQ